jgi:uracil-DNA glycosylase
MAISFKNILDKAYQNKSINELLAASPAALKGVTAKDAELLQQAFGIDTIRDLVTNKFIAYAQTLLSASGTPHFDPGPPPAWERFFLEAPHDYYNSHPSNRFRLAYGCVYYRGRLDDTARVMIVGQDPACDEIIAQRCFVGRSGQCLQGLLTKLGITCSYTMLNTFLYSVFDQFDNELENISLEEPILRYRNQWFDRIIARNPIEAIVTIGAGARHAVEHWPSRPVNIPVFNLIHPAAPEWLVLPNWNQALPDMQAAINKDDDGVVDTTLYGEAFTQEDRAPIPRFDLPFGIPSWHGTGGGHSQRNGNNMIVWHAPES